MGSFVENIVNRTATLEDQSLQSNARIEQNRSNFDKVQEDLHSLIEKQREVLTNEDLNEIRDRIETKANKSDIAELYEMKSNKLDIASLVKTIDLVHKQLE